MSGFFPPGYNESTDPITYGSNSTFYPPDYDPETQAVIDTTTTNSFFIENPLELVYIDQCKYWAELAEQYAGEASDSADLAEYWALYAEEAAANFELIVDTSPQLGGDLDVNNFSIVSALGLDIAITPDTTGSIILDGALWPQADGSANDVLQTDGSGNLFWAEVVVVTDWIEIGGYTQAITTLEIIDASAYNAWKAVQTANLEFSFTGVPVGMYTCTFEIESDGSSSTTWPINTTWVNGIEPPVLTAGNILQVVLSTSNLGTDWTGSHNIIDPTPSPLFSKGDLFTYTTEDAALSVGVNGLFLSSDSAEISGLKWIAAVVPGDNVSDLTNDALYLQDGDTLNGGTY